MTSSDRETLRPPNAGSGGDGEAPDVMAEIRDLLYGDLRRDHGDRLARLERAVARLQAAPGERFGALENELGDLDARLARVERALDRLSALYDERLADLDGSPWHDLRNAIAALAYRVRQLEDGRPIQSGGGD